MVEAIAFDRSEVDKEACAWIAQFDGGEPSAADLEAFREWVNRSPQHREAIERLSSLWGELNVLTELAVPARNKRRQPSAAFLAGAAATLLLLIGVVTWFGPTAQNSPPSPAVYATAVGEQRTIELSDGSTVQLNTASRLDVIFSKEERTLYLMAGEGYFDVTHDAARPFLVHVGGKTIRAVGTAFSVQNAGDILEVLVTEGTVELSSEIHRRADGTSTREVLGTVERGQRIRLRRPQGEITDNSQATESISEAELARELAWREGMLSFAGEPLALVIDEIGRYTQRRIIIEDASLGALRIGGYFRAGDTDMMLDTLEAGFPIDVHRMSDGSVRLRARE
ncbi:MAG: FecR family protein [Pseudomonadota bacterium]